MERKLQNSRLHFAFVNLTSNEFIKKFNEKDMKVEIIV